MSRSSSRNNRRKPSRWGATKPAAVGAVSATGRRPAAASTTTTYMGDANTTQRTSSSSSKTTTSGATHNISDEHALQALLSSAQARQEEREHQQTATRRNRSSSSSHHQFDHPNDHPHPATRDGHSSSSHSSRRDRDRPSHERLQEHPSHPRPFKRSRTSDQPKPKKAGAPADDYYGPASHHQQPSTEETGESTTTPMEKPNFALSGALATDTRTSGRMYKGVLLKFQEPPEAKTPATQWRLYVFKKQNNNSAKSKSKNNNSNDEPVDILHISKQSAYLCGRHADVCDVVLHHASCSLQHAVLQYRAVPSKQKSAAAGQPPVVVVQPYLMDLESTHGTTINGVRIDPARYYQLKPGDVIQFGASTREYVLLAAK